MYTATTIVHCVAENVPTLASYSVDRQGLISVIFGKQHHSAHFQKWYAHSTLLVSLHLLALFAFNSATEMTRQQGFEAVPHWHTVKRITKHRRQSCCQSRKQLHAWRRNETL